MSSRNRLNYQLTEGQNFFHAIESHIEKRPPAAPAHQRHSACLRTAQGDFSHSNSTTKNGRAGVGCGWGEMAGSPRRWTMDAHHHNHRQRKGHPWKTLQKTGIGSLCSIQTLRSLRLRMRQLVAWLDWWKLGCPLFDAVMSSWTTHSTSTWKSCQVQSSNVYFCICLTPILPG